MQANRSLALALSGIASAAIAQTSEHRLDRPWDIYARSTDADASITPSEPLIAALPYDGTSSYGARAQDFESIYDTYDLFVIEDIAPTQDAALGEFRSAGFGSGNPFGAEDVVVRIFEDDGSGLPGSDFYTGELVLTSTPGEGFFDGQEWITDFGGQCLSAGSYFLVWAVRLDFSCCIASFCYIQSGAPNVGGGEANNAWWWNPGGAFFPDIHFPIRDLNTGERTGVNYLLFGEPVCANPDCPVDFDFDGDVDGDDFFAYLDLFASDDPCADLTGNGVLDVNDFFAFLDLFVEGCD